MNALGQVKRIVEIGIVKLPDGRIAITHIMDPAVDLGQVIMLLDQVQTKMIQVYESVGPEATGKDFIDAENLSHHKTKTHEAAHPK